MQMQKKQVQLKIEPRPPLPIAKPMRLFSQVPDDIDEPKRTFKEIPPRELKPVPKEFRATPPVQGGHGQSSAGNSVFDSGFSGTGSGEEDRYPFQPNIFQDPEHILTGVDQRSGLDLSDPQQVLVGQMHLYGPLEHHFANLGRHDDDYNNLWPW